LAVVTCAVENDPRRQGRKLCPGIFYGQENCTDFYSVSDKFAVMKSMGGEFCHDYTTNVTGFQGYTDEQGIYHISVQGEILLVPLFSFFCSSNLSD
jgi:hypothetical protein